MSEPVPISESQSMQHEASASAGHAASMIQMQAIWKSFPGVVANRNVDFGLRIGEVHALLGENGAGKSTLMNILSGIYHPDSGQIYMRGKRVRFHGPAAAIAMGIGMVHQHFMLVDTFTVAENVHLGWTDTPWQVSPQALHRRTNELSSKYGLQVHSDARIYQLSAGEQQRVEILRVLSRGADILILDEPTAVLTPDEASELFKALRTLTEKGHTVVFISHKLDEVMQVSDRITVLRGGRNVATLPTSDCNQRILANLMVGKDVVDRQYQKKDVTGHMVVQVSGVTAMGDRGLPAIRTINLSIRTGEIVGVAGVAGNGQRELAQVLTGMRRTQSGTLTIAGLNLTNRSPRVFSEAGVGHIPEDRLRTGLAAGLSVTRNAILREYTRPPITRGWRLMLDAAATFTQELLELANVHIPSIYMPVRNLSGGNQQRFVTRRETRIASDILIAAYPTRGLDVAAMNDVRKVLVERRNQGVAVLLISEDLDEIISLSDRIIVMYEGRIVGELDAAQADRERIGLLMGGTEELACG